MPVHFKGRSEYDAHYKWIDSYLSQSFEPTPEQAARMAGLASAQIGITMEPQMSRKKRTPGPATTLSTDFNQYIETPSDDFALLGKNDKFSENVRYKAKSRSKSLPRDASPPKQQRLSKQGKENKAVPRLRPYEPAPVVDTSKFRQLAPQDPPTPQTPRKEKNEPAGIAKELKQTKIIKPAQERKSREERRSKDDNLSANKMEAVKKRTIKDKQISNMNEFAQTNLDKGVALSAPEAPSEYALKYKAGIAPPRPARKASEYAKAFTWKDRVASSPLIAAEQIVYNSNPAVAPFKAEFPKTSEYAAQFKQYKLVTPRGVSDEEQIAAAVPTKKRSKVKRSKSMGALRPDTAPAAGSAPIISPDNKRQTVESELQGTVLEERVPAVKHGKMRRVKSEYASNFQSPTKYNVEKGAWRGADPPHLKPTVEPEQFTAEAKSAGESDDGKPVLSNWFAEVLELRRKAKEYRQRAQGTHFSREHLVQLMAQQNELWEQTSSARSATSTLSALSLESGMEARRRKKDYEDADSEDDSASDCYAAYHPNVTALFQTVLRRAVTSDKSPTRQGKSPIRQGKSPIRQGKSPTRQSKSPTRQSVSPARQRTSPTRQSKSPTRQSTSPVRQNKSPTRQGRSPTRSPSRHDKSPTRLMVQSQHSDKSMDYMSKDVTPKVVKHKKEDTPSGVVADLRVGVKECLNHEAGQDIGHHGHTRKAWEQHDPGYERYARNSKSCPEKDERVKEEDLHPNEELVSATESKLEQTEDFTAVTEGRECVPAGGDKESLLDEGSLTGKLSGAVEGQETCTRKKDAKTGDDFEEIKEKAQEKIAQKEELADDKVITSDDVQNDEARQKEGPGDDVSLLAHEGSDEEAGQPDTEAEPHEDVLRRRRSSGKKASQRRPAWEEDDYDVGSELTPVSQVSSDGPGRIPTPQLKQATSSTRHHFDRTTPVVGGSLLSSPPRSDSKPRRSGKRQVKKNISKSWCIPADVMGVDDSSTITSNQSYSPIAGQSQGRVYDVRKGTISATPTFGSPSKDTHALRDDEASTDRPLHTTFVNTPAKSLPVVSDSSEQVITRPKHAKPSKFDLQPTVLEGVGQTYSKPLSIGIDGGLPIPRADPDDDVLSLSARSVASSCSLASEVYERAQKRTKEFWGKDGIASR